MNKLFTFFALALIITSAFSCKKTDLLSEREKSRPDYKGTQMNLKLQNKVYTLKYLRRKDDYSNLLGTTNYPICMADDKFTLSESGQMTWEFNNRCSTLNISPELAKAWPANWGATPEGDSLSINEIDERGLITKSKLPGTVRFKIESLDIANKTLDLTCTEDGVEIRRTYTYTDK